MMAMAMMTTMATIMMMTPPKAATMMAIVVQVLLVVDEASCERLQIPVGLVPGAMAAPCSPAEQNNGQAGRV